jgi:hypothetical protein
MGRISSTRTEPGHLRATIEWFSTFSEDVKNDEAYGKVKLAMPVLAVGGSASLGGSVAAQFRRYATHVTGRVIPHMGHWLLLRDGTGSGFVRGAEDVVGWTEAVVALR